MPDPTDEQLRAFVAKLPDIYHYIFKTFPALVPDRRLGDGLTEASLLDAFFDVMDDYSRDEVTDAIEQLVRRGFLDQHTRARFFSPTPLGERLIEIISGKKARTKGAPPLPEPAWG